MGVMGRGAGFALMMVVWTANPAAAQAEPPSTVSQSPSPFVPVDFTVPTLIEGSGFRLVPLGPALVKVDFDAYMSSIEHLQKTFTRSTAWPHAGLSEAAVGYQGGIRRRV